MMVTLLIAKRMPSTLLRLVKMLLPTTWSALLRLALSTLP